MFSVFGYVWDKVPERNGAEAEKMRLHKGKMPEVIEENPISGYTMVRIVERLHNTTHSTYN